MPALNAIERTTLFAHRGEMFLFVGLLLWCLAFAPYYPILLLAAQLLVGPIALILLMIFAWQSLSRSATALRIVLSLLLFLVAIGALYCSSLQTVTMMHRLFPPPHGTVPPTTRDWAL